MGTDQGVSIAAAGRGVVATVEPPAVAVGDWVMVRSGGRDRVSVVTTAWLRTRNRYTPNWRHRLIEVRKPNGARWTRWEESVKN